MASGVTIFSAHSLSVRAGPAAGKMPAFDASNYTAERLAALDAARDVVGGPEIAVFQPNHTLIPCAEFERPVRQYCRDHGISVMPHFSLTGGFLTGKAHTAGDRTGARGAGRGTDWRDELDAGRGADCNAGQGEYAGRMIREFTGATRILH